MHDRYPRVNNFLWLTGICGRPTLPGMDTAKDIVSAIGKAKLAAAFGIKESAVNMALIRGPLPASWFAYCESQLGPLPRHLFAFKGMGYHNTGEET
jgi:hypothetical protein